MKNKIYLYGASGHAKVIIDILKAQGIEVMALIDDNPDINELQGYPIMHDHSGLSPFIVSIGSNIIRKKVVEKLDISRTILLLFGAMWQYRFQ